MSHASHENEDIRYVILLTENPDISTTKELVFEHVQHLVDLERQELLVLCGPFADYPGGIIIIKAVSWEAAQEIAERDPFIISGARKYELRTLGMSHQGNNHMGVLDAPSKP